MISGCATSYTHTQRYGSKKDGKRGITIKHCRGGSLTNLTSNHAVSDAFLYQGHWGKLGTYQTGENIYAILLQTIAASVQLFE